MIGIKSGWGSLKAVMGNVDYEIPSEMSHDIVGYVRFDLGDLSFDPGRENLSLDTKTKETLIAKMEEVRSQLKDYLIKEIEKEPTIYDYVETMEYGKAHEISFIMLVLSFVLLALVYKLNRNWELVKGGES